MSHEHAVAGAVSFQPLATDAHVGARQARDTKICRGHHAAKFLAWMATTRCQSQQGAAQNSAPLSVVTVAGVEHTWHIHIQDVSKKVGPWMQSTSCFLTPIMVICQDLMSLPVDLLGNKVAATNSII